ncbi:putative E3 ubiquitin-protein ligase [Microbotryomycetes sp. JL221]|nr:putative E3 ubiquitin-protein ligase [Microbotryomycetes sp. JL221]
MYRPPPSSPPSAYPPLGSSNSFNSGSVASPPPPPPPPRWQPGQSFYLSGSASPSHIAHRTPTRQGTQQQQQYSAPSGPPPPPPQLMPQQATEAAQCICCNTSLRYPRHSLNFRCTVCGTINDLQPPTDPTRATQAPLIPPRSNLSAQDVTNLQISLSQNRPPASLSSSLGALDIHDNDQRSTTAIKSDPESALVDAVRKAFATLDSLQASFRADTPSNNRQLPRYSTLKSFYNLVKRHPLALEELKRLVGALLMRPGPNLTKGDGSWLISLIEAPVFYPDSGVETNHRQHLVSSLIGLMSNLPNNIHHALVAHYMSSPTDAYPREALQRKIEVVVSFISMRIGRNMQQGTENNSPGTGGGYENDWAVRAAAKVSSLFFAANTNIPRVPVSSFYVTLVDSLGEAALIHSFLRWEQRQGFSLCSYPHLMSLGTKMTLLEFDGKRQMQDKAREALISTLMRRMLEMPFLHLKVRRSFLVQDSLEQISANRYNLKKALKVTFLGEEGIDAGGVRKEWFLLLCRDLFGSQYGMFVHDSDTNLCWFNPVSQDLDEFYLVGVVVGLACYNTATLDVPLPTAVYKKLQNETVTLRDLATFQPSLARGLQQLLDYEGNDVEQVFCRSFVGEIEEWGTIREVELVPNGSNKSVTNDNRQEFVDLYVDFLLTKSVEQQFKAFRSGFEQVTSGNSLSLFKGEELELLVRGSSEELDIEQLEHATVYEGWTEDDETVKMFWRVFKSFEGSKQRKLLLFITGSDRVPATGTSGLSLKITCSGSDVSRFPTSHTCFNQLCLYRYPDEQTMRERLETAMNESEGFGLR